MHLPQHAFDELRRLIHQLCGLVIPNEKSYLIRHRLEPLARAAGCQDFEDFARRLRGREGPPLHDAIVEAITTAETSFFRDRHPFEAFRQHFLPGVAELLRRRPRQGAAPRVRIWSVACATGQEPYSLAMLLHDYLDANRAAGVSEEDFGILATDISARVLDVAAGGEYGERDLKRGLKPEQIARYFERRRDVWRVREPIRRLVEFRRLNLIQPVAGLGQFDAIFCRNVLIYFDETARKRVYQRFQGMLHPGGWLVLGSAENLFGNSDGFETVRFGDTVVYRRPK